MALLLYNGIIHTLDTRQPRAEALAIAQGHIVAVGSEREARATLAGQPVEGIDLRGRTVIPGLTDAHVHITWYGLSRRQVRLSDTRSLPEALARIGQQAQQLAPTSWLLGGGWNHTDWGEAWPTCADLDRVCPHAPAMLMRKDGHSIWVNSRALALAGIDHTTPDPPEGQIQRDAAGQPTGILLEAAQELVRGKVPPPTAEERLAATYDAMQEALSYGLTSLHIPPSPDPDDGQQTMADLHVLAARGNLPLRCLAHIALRELEAALALGLRSGLGDRWLRLGGVKIFADGSLGSETAALLAPYAGRQHQGSTLLPPHELAAVVRRASSGGINVVVHAIGDAANRHVLDAIEQAQQAAGQDSASHHTEPPAMPHRIEHAQLVHPADIPRFAALGVIASMQPVHATSDMHMAARLWGQRCATAYALRALHAAGATLALGSDAPVEPLNPWLGIHAAVTRQRPDNTPPGGWYAEQALSLHETLHGFCIGPAIASAEATHKGRLAPGMLADMAILPADPFALPPQQLHTLSADITLVEGQIVWKKQGQ